MINRFLVGALALFATCSASATESTVAQSIAELRYDGQGDVTYFIGAASWAPPSCPNATYVQVLDTVPGRKQLLAIALAAKSTNTKVTFVGTCHTDPMYFNAKYITVGQ